MGVILGVIFGLAVGFALGWFAAVAFVCGARADEDIRRMMEDR